MHTLYRVDLFVDLFTA